MISRAGRELTRVRRARLYDITVAALMTGNSSIKIYGNFVEGATGPSDEMVETPITPGQAP